VRAVRWLAGSTSGVAFVPPGNVVAPNEYANLTPVDMNADGDALVTGASGAIYFWPRGQSTSPVGNTFRMQAAIGANWAIEKYRVTDMNDAGWIVGTCDYAIAQGQPVRSRPVLWNSRNNQMVYDPGIALAFPGGFDPATEWAVADRLNERGTVLGTYGRQGLSRGIIWTSPQTPIVLQTVAGSPTTIETTTVVGAINDFDYAVGNQHNLQSGGQPEEVHPILWRPDGTAIPLNSLSTRDRTSPGATWSYYSVTSISNTGFVAGVGYFDPDGANGVAAYPRQYTILIPEAGSYGRGDVNLSGKIDFDDLLLLAQHYGQSNAALAYDQGDVNLDGTTDFEDLLTLAQHYSTPALAEAPEGLQWEWLRAVSLVPEPATAGALSLAAAAFGRRRRA
jgi:hypothetical protein